MKAGWFLMDNKNKNEQNKNNQNKNNQNKNEQNTDKVFKDENK